MHAQDVRPRALQVARQGKRMDRSSHKRRVVEFDPFLEPHVEFFE